MKAVIACGNLWQSSGAARWSLVLAVSSCWQLLSGGQVAIALPGPKPVRPSPHPVSQALPALQWTQQGNQVILNGRPLSAAWGQWQTSGKAGSVRTAVSDAGLTQIAGVELLNTSDVTQQPIQWFSQPTVEALALPTRLTGPLRYLDITEFAQRAGWQLQVKGTTLQISTPVAKVLAVRQGKQPWGDRLVLELDRPTTWQIDPQAQEFVVTLDGQIDPTVLAAFKPSPGTLVPTIKLESAANLTQVRLGIPIDLRPRIWSLPNPNRLVIDVRADALVDQDIQWAPGLRWRRQTVALGSDRFSVVSLEVNPRQPGLSVKPILSNPNAVVGIAPLFQTAQRTQVAAAINGGFFNRNNQLPLGALRRDGTWLSGPILNRGAIAWNSTGEIALGRLTLQEVLTLPTGERLPLTYLNSAYVQAGIARYTAGWGSTYTPLTDGETVVTVQNNRVAQQQTLGTAGSDSVPIPTDGYLLVLRSNPAAVNLAVGTTLRLDSTSNPPIFDRYPQIVAAGPLLLQNRQIVLDPKAERFSPAFVNERASRSAIGRLENGSLLIVAVHSRVNGPGPSLAEMAQLMQKLGAIDALNLDGGSSTTLYLGGQILDRPPRTTARVHNGIGVFIQPNP